MAGSHLTFRGPPVVWRHPPQVKAFRKANCMKVKGGLPPLLRNSDVAFPKPIAQALQRQPAPLQAQLWPMALSGQDVIAAPVQGQSGRLLGYLVPALVHVQAQRKPVQGDGPVVVVLCPTRDAVMEVEHALDVLRQDAHPRVVAAYPGMDEKADRRKQAGRLAQVGACAWRSRGNGPGYGSITMAVHRRRGRGTPPWNPPPPQTKGTIEGKNEIYSLGNFSYTNF